MVYSVWLKVMLSGLIVLQIMEVVSFN